MFVHVCVSIGQVVSHASSAPTTGTRHDIAHALAGAMQACHARPLQAFQMLLLHQDDTITNEPPCPPPTFLDQILAVAAVIPEPPSFTPLSLSRPDALLLLSRVARGYGALLCAPPRRADALVRGVVAGALGARDDQHTRLLGLKVVEELLQWRAAAGGEEQAGTVEGAALMGCVGGRRGIIRCFTTYSNLLPSYPST